MSDPLNSAHRDLLRTIPGLTAEDAERAAKVFERQFRASSAGRGKTFAAIGEDFQEAARTWAPRLWWGQGYVDAWRGWPDGRPVLTQPSPTVALALLGAA